MLIETHRRSGMVRIPARTISEEAIQEKFCRQGILGEEIIHIICFKQL